MTKPEIQVDKTSWGPGPWQDEPDRIEWRYRGLVCLMHRNERYGNWCGYVAVPPGHPAHGKGYEAIDVEVHGGLTYSGLCNGHICHEPDAGEPDNVQWFGFDCGHAYDQMPGIEALERLAGMPPLREAFSTPFPVEYRTAEWVKAEVERLADQLLAMGQP